MGVSFNAPAMPRSCWSKLEVSYSKRSNASSFQLFCKTLEAPTLPVLAANSLTKFTAVREFDVGMGCEKVQPHVEWVDRATSCARDQATSTDDADEAGVQHLFGWLTQRLSHFETETTIFLTTKVWILY